MNSQALSQSTSSLPSFSGFLYSFIYNFKTYKQQQIPLAMHPITTSPALTPCTLYVLRLAIPISISYTTPIYVNRCRSNKSPTLFLRIDLVLHLYLTLPLRNSCNQLHPAVTISTCHYHHHYDTIAPEAPGPMTKSTNINTTDTDVNTDTSRSLSCQRTNLNNTSFLRILVTVQTVSIYMVRCEDKIFIAVVVERKILFLVRLFF